VVYDYNEPTVNSHQRLTHLLLRVCWLSRACLHIITAVSNVSFTSLSPDRSQPDLSYVGRECPPVVPLTCIHDEYACIKSILFDGRIVQLGGKGQHCSIQIAECYLQHSLFSRACARASILGPELNSLVNKLDIFQFLINEAKCHHAIDYLHRDFFAWMEANEEKRKSVETMMGSDKENH